MIDFVLSILREIVDHPEDIRITAIDGQKTLVLEMSCHASDLGKVIGKNGKTIGAVRQLLGAVAARHGRRAMIEVID